MTIKELSRLAGVSKVSLYALLKKPEYASHVSKIDGVSHIDDVGAGLALEYYSRERDAAFKGAFNQNEQVKSTDAADTIEMLLGQIAVKDRQLAEKDSQINALLAIVKNEQLRAVPLLPAPVGEKKTGIFRRWFKKG